MSSEKQYDAGEQASPRDLVRRSIDQQRAEEMIEQISLGMLATNAFVEPAYYSNSVGMETRKMATVPLSLFEQQVAVFFQRRVRPTVIGAQQETSTSSFYVLDADKKLFVGRQLTSLVCNPDTERFQLAGDAVFFGVNVGEKTVTLQQGLGLIERFEKKEFALKARSLYDHVLPALSHYRYDAGHFTAYLDKQEGYSIKLG